VRVSHKTVALVLAGGVLLSGGMALAGGAFDRSTASRDIISSAAEDLGVKPDELREALRSAALEQVKAALRAGDISQGHALALQRLIEAGRHPFPGAFLGLPRPSGFAGPFGEVFGTAADYLDISESELRARLRNGSTLAEIAAAREKSVDGLVDALVEEHRAGLQQAVDEGRLSAAERDEVLDCIRGRMSRLVRDHFRLFGARPGGLLHPGARAWFFDPTRRPR
jgi:outer membrane murein-binding lipoprotein Lpp